MFDIIQLDVKFIIAVLSYIYLGFAILVDYVVYDQSLSWVQIIGVGLIVVAGFSNNRDINLLTLILQYRRFREKP